MTGFITRTTKFLRSTLEDKPFMAEPQSQNELSILLVEDKQAAPLTISVALKESGYRLARATGHREARRLLRATPPDLILIDNGISRSLLQVATAAGIPAMVISGEDSVDARVQCLEEGAADYMVKPVEVRELLLRLKTMSRLLPPRSSRKTVLGPGAAKFSLDLSKRLVQHGDGSRARLTDAEFRLLRLFLECPNIVLDRRRLGLEINQKVYEKDNRTIDVLVSKLRKKIDAPNAPSMINTVRNAGYVFVMQRDPDF